jgi:hypothetical protein
MGITHDSGQPTAVTVGGARTSLAKGKNGQAPISATRVSDAVHLHSIVA